MSAVSPGFYAYPALDYSQAEFLSTFTVVPVATPTILANIVVAGGGDAIYVTDIKVSFTTGAGVANRTLTINVIDGDGNSIVFATAAGAQAASTSANHTWGVGISAPTFLTGLSYTPLPRLVLPPGYKYQLLIQSVQAGDSNPAVAVQGLKVSTLGVDTGQSVLTPTPLLA